MSRQDRYNLQSAEMALRSKMHEFLFLFPSPSVLPRSSPSTFSPVLPFLPSIASTLRFSFPLIFWLLPFFVLPILPWFFLLILAWVSIIPLPSTSSLIPVLAFFTIQAFFSPIQFTFAFLVTIIFFPSLLPLLFPFFYLLLFFLTFPLPISFAPIAASLIPASIVGAIFIFGFFTSPSIVRVRDIPVFSSFARLLLIALTTCPQVWLKCHSLLLCRTIFSLMPSWYQAGTFSTSKFWCCFPSWACWLSPTSRSFSPLSLPPHRLTPSKQSWLPFLKASDFQRSSALCGNYMTDGQVQKFGIASIAYWVSFPVGIRIPRVESLAMANAFLAVPSGAKVAKYWRIFGWIFDFAVWALFKRAGRRSLCDFEENG